MQVLLISDGCITGWDKLNQGQLWLTPDSLVRVGLRSLTVRAATRGGLANFGAVGGRIAMALEKGKELEKSKVTGSNVEVDSDAWDTYLVKHERNVLRIVLDDIVQAELRNGLVASRLLVTSRDGTSRKLLWTRNRLVAEPLRRALASQLSAKQPG